MLSKTLEKAINEQINAEMWSAYLYLSMSAYCYAIGHPGFGNWYNVQFQEEQDHAKILFNYVIRRGGRVILQPIEAVPAEWEGLLDVVKATLAHEQKVTALIDALYAQAAAENDYATTSALRWFVDEQVEEEESAQEIIDHLNMVKDNGYGLYMLDKELQERKYSVASPLKNKD